MSHIIIQDNFYKDAKILRTEFDSNFKDPRKTESKRFVWDYWHIEDQYTLIRTPAYHYFNAKVYQQFHQHLVDWGREILGCHDISAPWLSYYIDGCKQELHSDVPHGPWAFVWSLTNFKKRKWSGGETFILKPQVLDYWNNFVDEEDREADSFISKIKPEFNRLTVFDPRFPHGVTEVKGTLNPMDSRLVIHGWFVEPRPYVKGSLSTAAVQQGLELSMKNLQEAMSSMSLFHGTMSIRLSISADGVVEKITWLTNTVLSLSGDPKDSKMLSKLIEQIFLKAKFRKAKGGSYVTVPLLFK